MPCLSVRAGVPIHSPRPVRIICVFQITKWRFIHSFMYSFNQHFLSILACQAHALVLRIQDILTDVFWRGTQIPTIGCGWLKTNWPSFVLFSLLSFLCLFCTFLLFIAYLSFFFPFSLFFPPFFLNPTMAQYFQKATLVFCFAHLFHSTSIYQWLRANHCSDQIRLIWQF